MLNTQFQSTYEATQAWVSRTHTEGTSLGVKFKGDYFYSGETIIARLLSSAVVLTSTSYGMAVTKHRVAAEAASRDYKQVFVPFCELSLAENAKDAKEQIHALLIKAATATVKREQLTKEAISIAQNLNMFAVLLGEPEGAIPMAQFDNINYQALKHEAQGARLSKNKKRAVKAGKKVTYKLTAPQVDNLVPLTTRNTEKSSGLSISNAFSLLEGLHNMTAAGISIKETIHASIEIPADIAPNGDITVGGQSITYSDLQKVRGIFGIK